MPDLGSRTDNQICWCLQQCQMQSSQAKPIQGIGCGAREGDATLPVRQLFPTAGTCTKHLCARNLAFPPSQLAVSDSAHPGLFPSSTA